MFSKLLRSIGHGIAGVIHVVHTERNMKFHLVAAAGVTAVGFAFKIGGFEWIAVVMCVGFVIALECVNTGIERLADRTTKNQDPLVQQAKDASAAGVLVASLMAAMVGGIIFPRIWSLMKQL